MLAHIYFISVEDLVDKFVSSFEIEHSEEEIPDYLLNIRNRTMKLIRMWADSKYSSLSRSQVGIDKLLVFLEHPSVESHNQNKAIRKALLLRMSDRFVKSSEGLTRAACDMTMIESAELAKQIAVLDHSLLSAIPPFELMQGAYMKPGARHTRLQYAELRRAFAKLLTHGGEVQRVERVDCIRDCIEREEGAANRYIAVLD